MTERHALRTSDFDYPLPPELIAQHPIAARGASRLMVLHRDTNRLEHRWFADFPSLLSPGDCLVLNTTRVRHARLIGHRPSGAPAEVLLIHPGVNGTWIAMGKPGSALRPGKRIALSDSIAIETLEVFENGNRAIRFIGASAEEAMQRFGRLPLPPYIRRDPDERDEAGYQTIYADRESSVAAPTAGLHFTAETLAHVERMGVAIARLELEVGPGTFKPVEGEDIGTHAMHPERYHVPEAARDLVAGTRRRGGRVWAVGTTVVRALESAAVSGALRAGSGETTLMITPGYRFRVVDCLLTNFHLPRSTLLMLVSALAGHELVMRAYTEAVEQRYRFYSYGDAMAIP
ncbi:MAG: tRNA preQ1(34) S-adenosylmethionine ribosyltransferase-isomerase QueA [Gemmatimonadota bacterium]